MARRGPLTEEQRQELRARMEKGRAAAALRRSETPEAVVGKEVGLEIELADF